jgi:hypothetical protein
MLIILKSIVIYTHVVLNSKAIFGFKDPLTWTK